MHKGKDIAHQVGPKTRFDDGVEIDLCRDDLALDDLDERRKTAKEQLASVETRIANLNAEREAILAESRQQAEALKQGIVEEAHRQAAQIVEQARLTAENEGRAIFAEVRASIADEIVNAAEKALSSKLNAAEHDKLIANSLNKVVLH